MQDDGQQTTSLDTAPFWAIGDPGRAALELPAGRPPDAAGTADFAASTASLGGMAVRAATARGLLHRSTGAPRQDAFALASRVLPSGEECLVAVVCDGVGSLGRSHEAANAVARVLATEAADGQDWPRAFARGNEVVRDMLAAAAATVNANSDADSEGMATTAVALVLRREGSTWIGDVGWIGDSSCWHLSSDGTWTAISGVEAENDETYHSGRVRPLPSADGACEHRTFEIRDGSLFLFTDGVANPMRWSDQVQATLAAWWKGPPDPLTFAGQVTFARKTHIDDRTAVGIWALDEMYGEHAGPQS